MSSEIPANPKIFHICHIDRLPSILADGGLHSDATIIQREASGTMIGLAEIKARRLQSYLSSHPNLTVGQCVPLYFCPRSVMLFIIARSNHPDVQYRGGQGPIIHLQFDMRAVIRFVEQSAARWAFTTSNAGARYFEDWCSLDELGKIHWPAVNAYNWAGPFKEGKQAEFLVESFLPWKLVEKIGIQNLEIAARTKRIISGEVHIPPVEVLLNWYY